MEHPVTRERAVRTEEARLNGTSLDQESSALPGLVAAEAVEGEIGEAGVLRGPHPVLNSGVAAVAESKRREVLAGGAGDEADVAEARRDVEQAELGAGVRTLASTDEPRMLGPGTEVDEVGELDHRGTVSR